MRGIEGFYKVGNRIIPVIYDVDFEHSPRMIRTFFDGKLLQERRTRRRFFETAVGNDGMMSLPAHEPIGGKKGDEFVVFGGKQIRLDRMIIGYGGRSDDLDYNTLKFDPTDPKEHFVMEQPSSYNLISRLLTNKEECTLYLDGVEFEVATFDQDRITLSWKNRIISHQRIVAFESGQKEIGKIELGKMDILDAITEFRKYISSVWEAQKESVVHFYL